MDERTSKGDGERNITAYPLVDQPAPLQSAAEDWTWSKTNETGRSIRRTELAHNSAAADLALPSTNRQGWWVCCPLAIEATWNGGPNAEDIEIRLAEESTAQPAFVQSNLGEGLLTFYPGYQFKTEEEHLLWLRGPINAPKDGLYALESLIDASLLPCAAAIHWQFTRPHQTIRFAAGEPFATLLLYPKAGLEPAKVEVTQVEESEDAYAQAFQHLIETPALHDLFLRLSANPAAPSTGVARASDPLPDGCFDTIDGRIDLEQFEAGFFVPERFFGRPPENYLRRDGEINRRMFYVLDALKLVYLEIPKVACTAIKLTVARAIGISFEALDNFEYHLHLHPQWHREAGRLNRAQRGYYRFSFVRNPFDRLVSCYRSKVIFRQSRQARSPHYRDYFFAIPVNISFADFVDRVSKIPDALADAHFKSQHAMLYRGEELQVDYLGKFEQLEQDWQPIAEQYQLDPLLAYANYSKNKPGCHSDYRLYYSEALVQLVYERYRQDVHQFGYAEEYEQLLAFVRQHPPSPTPVVNTSEKHKETISTSVVALEGFRAAQGAKRQEILRSFLIRQRDFALQAQPNLREVTTKSLHSETDSGHLPEVLAVTIVKVSL